MAGRVQYIADYPGDEVERSLLVPIGMSMLLLSAAQARSESSASPPAAFEQTDQIFADFVLDRHIPGLVYGIVANGQLVHVGTYGVQTLESQRPVTANTLFRIASMTKAFTALTLLKLRDDSRVRLDANAEDYVPELRGWKYPTDD